jgi:hypothetical protein
MNNKQNRTLSVHSRHLDFKIFCFFLGPLMIKLYLSFHRLLFLHMKIFRQNLFREFAVGNFDNGGNSEAEIRRSYPAAGLFAVSAGIIDIRVSFRSELVVHHSLYTSANALFNMKQAKLFTSQNLMQHPSRN